MGITDRITAAYNAFRGKRQPLQINTNTQVVGYPSPVYGEGNQQSNISDGYIGSDQAFSIIRKIARTAAMIPLNVMYVKDEKALKEYQFACKTLTFNPQDQLKRELLKYKALESAGEEHPLQQLLDTPNDLYSKTEFREGAATMRLATGNTYLYAPLPELGTDYPVEMWLLPSPYMQPVVVNTFPRYITKYQMNLYGIKEFLKEEIIHIRYFNPRFTTDGGELIGLSPLKAGSKIVYRQKAETDFAVSGFQNGGMAGIASREDFDDANDPGLGKIKDDFYTEGSGPKANRKVLFMAGKWNYTHIGLSPVDMDILNSEVKTFKRLCNLYGVDDRLFNNDSTGSENSVKEMVRHLYTNAALPEVYALRDALNASLVPYFNKTGRKVYIDADITGIPELQEDMKRMADIFAGLPIMIPNQIMKAFGYDEDPNPDMNKVYVKTGYQLLEDIASVPDIQPVTPNGK